MRICERDLAGFSCEFMNNTRELKVVPVSAATSRTCLMKEAQSTKNKQQKMQKMAATIVSQIKGCVYVMRRGVKGCKPGLKTQDLREDKAHFKKNISISHFLTSITSKLCSKMTKTRHFCFIIWMKLVRFLSILVLTDDCREVGLWGRAADAESSPKVFLIVWDLDCWALAAWVLTDWSSWKSQHGYLHLQNKIKSPNLNRQRLDLLQSERKQEKYK